MKCKTFILNGFIQFTCTNLDGSQKEGGNFFNLLQKEGVLPSGGFPQKRGGVPNLEETMCCSGVFIVGFEGTQYVNLTLSTSSQLSKKLRSYHALPATFVKKSTLI